MGTAALIELKDIEYTYEHAKQPALHQIDLCVKKGEWVSVVGPGQAGKSTLCRLLSGVLQTWPGGTLQGEYKFKDRLVTLEDALAFAGEIGVVFEDPDTSLIHNIVEDELAFGPENLRVVPAKIEKRIEHALAAVGLPNARMDNTVTLSGGQKQRINIAAMLTMQPQIILLDDAEANLDHESAKRLRKTLCSLHEQGHTIIATSSRWEPELMPHVDQIIVLDQGRIVARGKPEQILTTHHGELIQLGSLPAPFQAQARRAESVRRTDSQSDQHDEPILQVKDLNYRYPTSPNDADPPVLQNVNFTLNKGDFAAVRGPNGSGKTTLSKLITGIIPIENDHIFLCGRKMTDWSDRNLAQMVGYVFQNPGHQFVAKTVLEECAYGLHMKSGISLTRPSGRHETKLLRNLEMAQVWLERFELISQQEANPYELSMADQRLLALASAFVIEPLLVVLDEPTAGLDFRAAARLMSYCDEYCRSGKAVMMITHDVEFSRPWVTKDLQLTRPEGIK